MKNFVENMFPQNEKNYHWEDPLKNGEKKGFRKPEN